MTPRLVRLALAVVLAVALAACSSSGSTSSAPKSHAKAEVAQSSATTLAGAATAVCKLFDVNGVDAFFKATTAVQYSDVRKCLRKSSGKAFVTISLWKDQNRDMFNSYKKARTDAQTIPELGDAANYSEQQQSVQVLKGDTVVTVELDGASGNASAARQFLVEQAKYATARV
jgi:hypothetical protein